ncbi:unnamed protein product, partial [Didymodactylos carnosus]
IDLQSSIQQQISKLCDLEICYNINNFDFLYWLLIKAPHLNELWMSTDSIFKFENDHTLHPLWPLLNRKIKHLHVVRADSDSVTTLRLLARLSNLFSQLKYFDLKLRDPSLTLLPEVISAILTNSNYKQLVCLSIKSNQCAKIQGLKHHYKQIVMEMTKLSEIEFTLKMHQKRLTI